MKFRNRHKVTLDCYVCYLNVISLLDVDFSILVSYETVSYIT